MTERASLYRVLDALERAGGSPRAAGADQYRARAVCHGGDSPGTLSIRWDARRRYTSLHCFKGCDRDAILWAIDLTRTEQYDELRAADASQFRQPRPAAPIPAGRPPTVFASAPAGWTPPIDLWMPPWCGHRKLDEYLYRDEDGRVLYGVARCANKDFAQWRPASDARGGRRWKLVEKDSAGRVVAAVRVVPYRLPELLAGVAGSQRIFVVEGEKDCHALANAGQVATCGKGGCGEGWHDAYNRFFTGARITIVADRDVPGRKYAEAVVKALVPVAACLEVVVATSGKDSADHLAGGGTPESFQTVWTPKEPTP